MINAVGGSLTKLHKPVSVMYKLKKKMLVGWLFGWLDTLFLRASQFYMGEVICGSVYPSKLFKKKV